MTSATRLLIIGAGPFGLAMAAYAREHQVDYRIVGKPMGFWKANMPRGMYLRSSWDWHLDPLGVHTIERYLETRNLQTSDVEPLSLDVYLDYTQWFQEQKAIETQQAFVQRLDYANDGFTATLDDDQTVAAQYVLIALGMGYFKHTPSEFVQLLPEGRYSHACDLVDFQRLEGKRCLIIGGRQSAFEWAALLSEAGVAEIHLSHRHATPEFKTSDWSWVSPLVDAMETDPGWFRRLTPEQQAELQRRLWVEGRLKLEPWLAKRISKDTIKLWPHSRVLSCDERAGGTLEVQLDSGAKLEVDHVILATGYKVDIERVPFLARGNTLAGMATRNGYPVLDEHFQCSIPGLFMTSFLATQDFGPFFGFTVGVRAAARIVGAALTSACGPELG